MQQERQKLIIDRRTNFKSEIEVRLSLNEFCIVSFMKRDLVCLLSCAFSAQKVIRIISKAAGMDYAITSGGDALQDRRTWST